MRRRPLLSPAASTLAGRLGLALLAALLAVGAFAASALADTPATPPSYTGTHFDGSGTPDGSMTVNRLAVNEETGDVYVIDCAHNVVDRFSSSGTYLSQLKVPQVGSVNEDQQFKFGCADDDIAVDNSGTATQGNVYVVGENNGASSGSRIAAFDASGTFKWQIEPHPEGSSGQSHFFIDICGVGVDSSGNLWADDYYAGVIQRSTQDGSFLEKGPNAGDAEFKGCHMAFDSTGALLLIKWQEATERFAPPAPFSGTATLIEGEKNFAVSADSLTGASYVNHEDGVTHEYKVAVHDQTGAAIGTPFGTTGKTYIGVAVDGANRKVYLSNTANEVEIWNAADPAKFSLNLDVGGNGSGQFKCKLGAAPAGACNAEYFENQEVTVIQTADAHSTFTGWSGACSGTGICKVKLTAAKSVTANFALETKALTVTKAGSGSGSVTCNGAACAAGYPYGTEVTLAATAASGSSFAGWSGGGCSGAGPCKVTLTADTAVTATFTANPIVVLPPVVPPPPPPVDNSAAYGQCVAKANKAFKAAKKAAAKKHGKAKSKALKKAAKKKGKAVAACKAQFK